MRRNIKTGVATNTLVSNLNSQYLNGKTLSTINDSMFIHDSLEITDTESFISFMSKYINYDAITNKIFVFRFAYGENGHISDAPNPFNLAGCICNYQSVNTFGKVFTFMCPPYNVNQFSTQMNRILQLKIYDATGGVNQPRIFWNSVIVDEDMKYYVTKTEFESRLAELQSQKSDLPES